MDKVKQKTGATEFGGKVLTATGIVGGVAFLALLTFFISDILLLVFGGILLATFLDGISTGVNKITGLSLRWSLLLALLGIAGLIALGVWLMLPHVSDQIDQLRVQLPAAFSKAVTQIEKIVPFERIQESLPRLQDLAFGKAGTTLFTQVAGLFSGTVTVIANIVIFLFAGFYLTLDPQLYIKGILALVPPPRRSRAREIVAAVGHTLRWWLIGTFLDMATVGILTGIGLWLLGIKLALILGILSGLLTFVPYIGPFLSAIPAVLLAFVEGPTMMLYVIALYVVVQAIEGNLTAPLIQQRTVSLPPVLTLTVQIVFGTFFGFLGLMLATPLAAAGLVLVKKIYIEDVLGDKSAGQ